MPVSDLEPLVPEAGSLIEPARKIVAVASVAGANLHAATLDAVAELLRTINCYYSNLIEGHDTHPISIERALHKDYSSIPAKRNLQIEARAHIEVQRLIETRLASAPDSNVCAPTFIRWVHEEFYSRLPPELRVVRHPTDNREEVVEPGALRAYDVRVGEHIAPSPDELPALLDRFASGYDPARYDDHRDQALIALAAAHHRLLWIHPFGDGNGRVTRLITDAYLRRARVGAHGLWTVSRGLARARDRYRMALADADSPRWNDLDGRGHLSARALASFCSFFLEVCDDQITFMSRMLDVTGLLERVSEYGRRRSLGIDAPEPAPTPDGVRGRKRITWRPEATRLLRAALTQGPLDRSIAYDIIALPERTGRRVVSELEREGFLTARTKRAPLHVHIPAHAAPHFFPGIYGPATSP